MVLDRKWVEQIRARLPELPEAKRERCVRQYDLPLYDAGLLTGSRAMADYFEELVKTRAASPKDVSNWLLGPASAIINLHNADVDEFRNRVSVQRFAGLLALEANATVNTATAKLVLEEMFDGGKTAEDIVREKGLGQISDAQAIADAVDRAVKSNPKALEDFRAGKESALKFLVGQVMRATRGRANPQMVNDLLKKKLAGE